MADVRLSDGTIELTPLGPEDLEPHLAGEDAELARRLNGGPGTREGVAAYLRHCREQWETAGPLRAFGIRAGEAGTLAGTVDLRFTAEGLGPGEVNVAYGLYPVWRGRGLATRAVRLVCRYAAGEGAARAVIRAEPDNAASLAVARRAGFTASGPSASADGTGFERYVLDLAATAPPRQSVRVEHLDGPGALRAEDALRTVYAEAFAGPPFHETAQDVEAAFRRFPVLAGRAAFRAVLARTADGEPVGMAYGHPLTADTVWWDELVDPVPEAVRREDGQRTFGLMELAVREPWRGQGVARRLHRALLDSVPAERVLLNVHPGSLQARAAYRAWGYRTVGPARRVGTGEDADRLDLMLLDLAAARR
ncbi:GNAT family N-acetyltransferase [Streptomyces sp. NPDC001478]